MKELIDSSGKGFIPIPRKNPRIVVQKGIPGGFNVYIPYSFYGKTKHWLARLFFPVLPFEVGLHEHVLNPLYNFFGRNIALSVYTGTKGYYRKPTVLIMDSMGKPLAYAKIALTEQVVPLLRKEKETLDKLEKLNLKTAYIPQVIYFDGKILITSTMKAAHPGFKFRKEYKLFLDELKEKTSENGKCLVHGDFAPWNILMADKPFIFDWEMSKFSVPEYDYFHFIIQVGVLLHHYSAIKIFELLKNYNQESLKIYLDNIIESNEKINTDGIFDNKEKHILDEVRKKLWRMVSREIRKTTL